MTVVETANNPGANDMRSTLNFGDLSTFDIDRVIRATRLPVATCKRRTRYNECHTHLEELNSYSLYLADDVLGRQSSVSLSVLPPATYLATA